MIGAGAKILGNVEIGPHARVAAGAVVLASVPANATVAGVPAKVLKLADAAKIAKGFDDFSETSLLDSFDFSI